MNDENKNQYNLDDDDFDIKPINNKNTPSMPNINPNKFKKILIPIYLILVIFLFYKFLTWLGHRKGPEEKIQTPPVATAVVPAAQQVPTVIQPPAPTADEIALKKISDLEQSIQENQDKAGEIKAAVETNQENLNNLNNTVTNLTASVNDLSGKVDKLVAAMKKPKKIVKKITPPKVVYHVKAIVTGRAWLEDPNGLTITVRPGDVINGGKVEMISPDQGIVALSTGEIIQYGRNDI